MLSGSNIKGVQGDTGRAHASMVTEQYAHILDDNRRMNAERFQQQFYSIPISEEPAVQPDPFQQLDTGEKQAFLVKLLTNPRRWHDDKAIGTGHVTQRGVKNPLKNMLLQKAEGIPQKVSFKKYSAGFSYIKFLEFRFYRPFFYDDNKSINCCCFFAKSMI